jgi:hypothetical protein
MSETNTHKTRGNEMEIPSDVKAYMEDAAVEIAKEKKFIPESEKELMSFMTTNNKTIVDRASKNMWNILKKIQKNGAQQKITNVMAAKYWHRVRTSEINRRTNNFINDVLA